MMKAVIVAVSCWIVLSSVARAEGFSRCIEKARQIVTSTERVERTGASLSAEPELLGRILTAVGYIDRWSAPFADSRGEPVATYHVELDSKTCQFLRLKRF